MSTALPPAEPDLKPVKEYTIEDVRRIVLTGTHIPGDLEGNLKLLGTEVLPKYFHTKGAEKEKAKKQFEEKGLEVLYALEAETHTALMGSFNESYRGMVKELSKQMIKEYDCRTHSEKMLVEIVVNALVRTLDHSTRLNGCLNAGEYITSNRTQYLAMLSKQIDRSHRQYITGLMALKQMKAPNIEMNIRAKNAFVSQNQQFNTETNEAK